MMQPHAVRTELETLGLTREEARREVKERLEAMREAKRRIEIEAVLDTLEVNYNPVGEED